MKMSSSSNRYDDQPPPHSSTTTTTTPFSSSMISGEIPSSNVSDRNVSSIKLQEWKSNEIYMTDLNKINRNDLYKEYFKRRTLNKKLPSYYLDMSDYFFKIGLPTEALSILTSILELELESPQLLRVVGYKLEEFGILDLSELIFRKVLKLKIEEPQSYRDLSLVLSKLEKYKEAIELMYEVIIKQWDNRFDEIEITSLIELNRMLNFSKENNNIIRKEFIFPIEFDLRIVMAWDTDSTDIDLHTLEPTGEEVFLFT